MNRFLSPLIVAIAAMATLTSAYGGVVLNDPLNGSTIGTRQNGTFTGGGWRVDNQYDTIYWHTPAVYPKGAFEYNVRGLPPGSCPGGFGFKNELSHMYDFTFGNADINYNGGYRDAPYKHFVRKQCESGKMDTLELVWVVNPNFIEPDTGALSWNSATTYLFRTEWENTGGQAILRVFRDGGLVFQGSLSGSWNPGGQSVRIAASPRRADEGANIGAIYSNVKVYDDQNSVPGAPTITAPNNGETIKSTVAYVQFSGDSHSMYQVRVNSVNDPNTGIVWDSQQVNSSRSFTWTGNLNNNTTYYVFARLGTSSGIGPWSATGRTFTVNTAFNPGGTDFVRVKGNSYANFSGPLNGLGFTYMRALYNCKYQRTRYTNDCSYMASKGYMYLRNLTMVSWDDLEIAPINMTNDVGQFVAGWSDYWQQFRDQIDIAYSNGLRTQITIFAGAQHCMPNDNDRTNHMNSILSNMPGREHKVVLIEVANEAWQNGLPDANDVRNKGNYLAANTTIPVALSSPSDTSDTGIVNYYAGSSADITTVHFTRDISAPEGGWRPVRDSYRTGLGGLAPVSSNEPIGAGSSVNTENDPMRLCMAGVFAWTANCISYVYHSRAGVFGWTGCCPPSGTETFFSASPGNDSYLAAVNLLPKDLSSWERNDGKASAAPFSSYCMGQSNKWWTEVGGATNGCLRNISAIKGGQFVSTPISILGGGLELEARRPMNFQVYNPTTGTVAYNLSKNPGDRFTLAQGGQAYIIIGNFTDVPGGGGGNGNEVTVDLGSPDIINGMTNVQGGDGDTTASTIGGRTGRKNVNAAEDFYMYFSVSDGYAFAGNRPNEFVSIDYYDTGTSTLNLQYDATDGNAYKIATGGVTLTNTNTWKTKTWTLTDAYFGNRQNGAADFRIAGPVGVTYHLDFIRVSVDPPPAPQTPFGGTNRPIPGVIQAEDFDNGGQNAAYNDVDVPNNGGQYRTTERVDIEVTTDTGGGYNVGWTESGEWLEYTVNVNQTGDYACKFRVASASSGGSFHLALNGANLFSSKNMAGTGGWQTYTTIIVPGIFMSSGNGKILRFEADTGGFNINYMDFVFGGADVISCDLNNPDVNDGMSHPQVGDGDTVGTTIGGHFARRNLDPGNDFYMYFEMADIYAFQGNKSNAAVTVEYYDTGTPTIGIQYDGTSNPYTQSSQITLTNTNTWKTHVFNLTGCYFGNRQNSGADFRINAPVGVSFNIDTVMVFSSAGAPPPGAPSVTAPGNGAVVTTLTPGITWTGDAHDQYEVHVTQVNDANTTTNGWGSGIVNSTGNSATSGTLRNYSFYYVFVRLHNANGWGAWSAAGRTFITNTNSNAGTVYLGNSLPTSNGWVLNGTQSWENDGSDIVSSFISDGGSTVWQIADNATNKRSKLKFQPGSFNIDFTTGATIAGRIRTAGGSGTCLHNLGTSNGGVGGHYLRIQTSQVVLVDFAGNNRGSFALDGTQYHKYQLSVKNTTAGNNSTATWKVYVDGTQRITWTGAGGADGGDGFLMGSETLSSTGTWLFDWVSCRNDGEFSPAQWDALP